MTTDPMEPGYRDYPPDPPNLYEEEDLFASGEVLCELCEEKKEAARGCDECDPNWGTFIDCKACKQEAADAIEREREEKEDLDRIRRS